MFDVYCPRHGCRVLLFPSDIEEIRNTGRGIEVRYSCYCGYRGTWCTGRGGGHAHPLNAGDVLSMEDAG